MPRSAVRIGCGERPEPIEGRVEVAPSRHVLQAHSDVRHMEWTLIRATGVSEEKKRDIPLSHFPEIKRGPGRIGQSKVRFCQGRRH